MSGPWEAFQAGPWAAYQAAPAPPQTTLSGLAQSVLGGIDKAVSGAADTVMRAGPVGQIMEMINLAADPASLGRPGGVPAIGPKPFATAAAKRDYTPKTSAEHVAQTAGEFLPAALAPGSIPARVANVALPVVGAEGAGRVTRAMGGSPEAVSAAQMAGGLIGGGAASLRPSLPGFMTDAATGFRNTVSPPDANAPATPEDALAATQQLAKMIATTGVKPEVLSDPFSKGLTTAEAIGRPGVMSLGALARRSGETPDALEALLAARKQAAPQRILNDFAAVSGLQPEEAAGNLDALTMRLQAQAKPLYDAALSSPEPVWNPDLANLAERPVIKKAIDLAGKSLKNAGQDPMAAGFQIDPDTGNFVLGMDLSKTIEQYPTAQTWDKVKKIVGAMVQRDPLTGRVISSGEVGIQNRDLQTASSDLTHALAGDPANGVPGAIPGYRAALDKAGDYLQMQSAFDRAQKAFLNPNVSAKDFAATFAKLTEPEQSAWRSGVAAKLAEQMQKGRLTPRQLMLPHVQAKLTAVLGQDGAQAFLQRLRAEAAMAATGRRMAPGEGSPTMEYANAAAEQEGGPNVLGLITSALKNPVGAVHSLAQQGRTIGTTPQIRNELGRLLMQAPGQTATDIEALPPPPPARSLFAPGGQLPILALIGASQLSAARKRQSRSPR